MRFCHTIAAVAGMTLLSQLPAMALNNGLSLTPPMGWNPWNCRCSSDSSFVRQIADAMVSTGLRDAGYVYVNLDCDSDGWMSRTSTGDYRINLKPLGDYIHSKGMKFGVYTDAGATNCCSGLGSYGRMFEDAAAWASWGADYVKVDWCGGGSWSGNYLSAYTTMRDALRATGRPIVLSICEWGTNRPWLWGDTVGNLWRVGYDIDNQSGLWNGVLYEADLAAAHPEAAGPGAWNDPDMMLVGHSELTIAEQRAHFSLWCILAAPLLIGCDLTNLSTMTPGALDILLNTEAIAVNQDSLGFQGRRVIDNGDQEVYAKRMLDGSRAVLLFNRGATAATISFTWADIWLPANEPCIARNLWTHQHLGSLSGTYSVSVPSHDVVMLRLTRAPGQTPLLISSYYTTPSSVVVTFSEPLDQATAENTANYAIDNGVSISAAVAQSDRRTVVLSTSALTHAVTYTLTVNNVRDRAPTPNTIAVNTTITFLFQNGITSIRYYPRSGWTSRMVGGVFEGTNGDRATGPYETIFTITTTPAEGAWTEVTGAELATSRYYPCVRYRSPDGGWCNVSEIEFYMNSTKMQGTVFGPEGSYDNLGNDFRKAFDGDTASYMDYNSPDGGYTGLFVPTTSAGNSHARHRADAARISVRTGAGMRMELRGVQSGQTARVAVYDLRGTLLRSQRVQPAPGGLFVLDACDNAGRPLGLGKYVVRVVAGDEKASLPLLVVP